MENKIFKETLSELDIITEIELPSTARILSFQNQNDKITFWYQFDTKDKLTKKFRFKVVHTGQEFNPYFDVYLTTVQLHNGNLVAHIYQCK